ncbi:MAG: hypothetical protein [Olavius algarvensis Gamma 3 endosymbiont]|nr:MAG: hypothetical protein [Olavius algarvensis Gamma 3 endosymbiont]
MTSKAAGNAASGIGADNYRNSGYTHNPVSRTVISAVKHYHLSGNSGIAPPKSPRADSINYLNY